MSSVDGEIYLDSSNTRLINAAEAKVCLARDVGDLENDLYEQEEKTKQYKVLYQEICRDINNQERHFAEQLYHQKYKRCLAMAGWCEATALWCYQAANTLPTGFRATLFGKPVKIEPDRLFDRFERLIKWSNRWMNLAKKFKPNKE